MALKAAKAANFGKSGIVINAHFEIGIAYRVTLGGEFVGQAEHARIAGQLDRGEI